MVALVTEKTEEFNRRNNLGDAWKPLKHYSAAVEARTILSREVITHIERCFSKIGMTIMAQGKRKRASIKSKEATDVPPEIAKEKVEAENDKVDEQPAIEYVPTDSEIKEDLEYEVFGGTVPRVKRRGRSKR